MTRTPKATTLPRATATLGALGIVSALLVAACGGTGDLARSEPAPARTPVEAVPAATALAAPARPRIVILGDSLTAGLGLRREQAYPSLLQQRLDADGLKYEAVNAGVSGDTSAGGLSRLDWALADEPHVLIVALGGNDALRGVPVDELERNLSAIIERAQAKDISVVLAGMEAPPNFGSAYTVAFHNVYPDLAKKYGVPLVPFLLDGVAGVETLNQRDGIHPTAEGARMVADNIWSVLRPLLKAS